MLQREGGRERRGFQEASILRVLLVFRHNVFEEGVVLMDGDVVDGVVGAAG